MEAKHDYSSSKKEKKRHDESDDESSDEETEGTKKKHSKKRIFRKGEDAGECAHPETAQPPRSTKQHQKQQCSSCHCFEANIQCLANVPDHTDGDGKTGEGKEKVTDFSSKDGDDIPDTFQRKKKKKSED